MPAEGEVWCLYCQFPLCGLRLPWQLKNLHHTRSAILSCSLLLASLGVPLAFVCLVGEEEAHLSQPLQPGQQAGAAWVTMRCERQGQAGPAWHFPGLQGSRISCSMYVLRRACNFGVRTARLSRPCMLLQAGRGAGRADCLPTRRGACCPGHGRRCQARIHRLCTLALQRRLLVAVCFTGRRWAACGQDRVIGIASLVHLHPLRS